MATRNVDDSVLSVVGAGGVAGSLLLLVVTGFLLASGAPLISSSSVYPTATTAVTSLKRAVGNAVVGFGASSAYPSSLGIMVNDNLLLRCSGICNVRPHDAPFVLLAVQSRNVPNCPRPKTYSVQRSPRRRRLGSTGSAICLSRPESPDPAALSSIEGWVPRTYIEYPVRHLPHWIALRHEWDASRHLHRRYTCQSGSSESQCVENGHSEHDPKCPPPQTHQRAGLARHH